MAACRPPNPCGRGSSPWREPSMIEIKQNIKFILKHPIKEHQLEISFLNDSMMDDWLPYLNKLEDYVIQEALKAKKKQ